MTVQYDPRKTVVSFNGVPISGFDEGTFITCTRRTPVGNLEPLGADGEGAFVFTGDHSYEIEIVLKKSSPSNTQLSQWANAAQGGNPVVGKFAVQDLTMFALFTAEEATITEIPPWSRGGGNTLGTNTWKFAAKRGIESQPGDST